MIEMIFEVEALVAGDCGVIRLELVVGALRRVGGLYLMMRRVEGGEEVVGDVLIVSGLEQVKLVRTTYSSVYPTHSPAH